MTIDFYYAPPSPFCRSVLLTAKAIGLDLNMKLVDINNGENMKPEFIAINPQHCVPTLVDGDLKLWERRHVSLTCRPTRT
ncbi:glutathione S-transferase 1-1-like [Oratosquilla oratoria]|uniref:glutathione S-transferase 1-1-like n=1 Tax=Oratosquilla oratoria TaxID=337810 RepID=UPI003F774A7C